MCFRSATEGQKAFLRKGLQEATPFTARQEPKWQRDQGQLESGRRARTGQGESQGSLRSGLES